MNEYIINNNNENIFHAYFLVDQNLKRKITIKIKFYFFEDFEKFENFVKKNVNF
mgnify:CR=1 FL=1